MSDDSKMQSTKKDKAWLAPNQDYSEGAKVFRAGLYLVATPIGNLRDITLRALDVLAAADLIACEDTRVTGKLLSAYSIKAKMMPYNDHSDEAARARIIEAAKDKCVVLCSDAGMPLVSDPGYKLVKQARQAGVYVSSMPGANAPLTALQLSALPSDQFSFLGFLPTKSAARKDMLERWRSVDSSLIAFDTAPRLLKTLHDIVEVMGAERKVAVTRELTKMYEDVRCDEVSQLVEHYETHGLPKGEIVLVIAPPDAQHYSEANIEELLLKALETMRTKEAASYVSDVTGAPKKELYKMALSLKGEGGA
tara:strand:+ start:384 stop:1307 length:924 start_codon:yes stop_codon:yes gene_type:complete